MSVKHSNAATNGNGFPARPTAAQMLFNPIGTTKGNVVIRKQGNMEIDGKEGTPETNETSQAPENATGISRNRQYRAAESLTRTKALLLAAIRVWELKQPRDV